MLANGIAGSAADSIKVGQKLVIPPVDGIIHKVEEGDAVKDLAVRYGADTLAIIKANALAEPYVLQPGHGAGDPRRQAARSAAAAAGPAAGRLHGLRGRHPRLDRRAVRRRAAHGRALQRARPLRPDLARPESDDPRRCAARTAGRRRGAALGAGPGSGAVAAPAPRAPQSPIQQIVRAALPRPAAPAPTPEPKPIVAPANGWGVVAQASKFLGYSYVWGGASPRGFDCTGFTWYTYQQMGKAIPLHDLWGQMQSGPRVSQANLQAGDLVFFANTYMPGLSHVGIYIGGGRFIHAGSERTGVTVSSLNDAYWGPRYYGATRPS